MSHFNILSPQTIATLTSTREGETKLGQTIQTITADRWEDVLKKNSASYVLIGIPEDIGVRANFGIGGTQSLWQPALKAILNIQETEKLKGASILALGYFDFSHWIKISQQEDIATLRKRVSQIDELAFPIIQTIVASGKTPIIIGGGHNNAYPLLKGSSLAIGKALNSVNLDAHSDYRIMEGRHSGNGFRYAHTEGFLRKYHIIGLHENYNSATVMEDINRHPDLHYTTYEAIFLHEKIDYATVLKQTAIALNDAPVGVELDLDCISNTLSSAATPCGISTLQARKYVSYFAEHTNVGYLHLTEGAVRLEDGRESALTPKLIAYLFSDFIKGCEQRKS